MPAEQPADSQGPAGDPNLVVGLLQPGLLVAAES